MQQIPAGEFKAKCLKIMDDIQKYHQEVIITKFNKPVVKIMPVESEETKALFGSMKGTMRIKGDIVKPSGEVWDADEKNL